MQIAGNIVQRLSSLRPTIQEICNVAGVPGVSLGVAHEGQVIFGIISDAVILTHPLHLTLIISTELDQ